MSVVPLFSEIFIGFLLVAGWTWALRRSAAAPGWLRAVPWVVGLGVVAGQAIGGLGIVGLGSPAWVVPSRQASAGLVLVGLVACGVATAQRFATRRNVTAAGATSAEPSDRGADPPSDRA